mgnify:CR=1 FL=1
MTNGSPFMNGIILTVTVALFVVGACYGFGCGKYKNDRDLFADITLGFKDMAGYIFMCFFIAQFTSYFAWSNLGIVMAIKGAEALKAMEFTGAPLLIGLIFVSCIVNILIGSASAKWAILAPIFVPMLMLMGFDPAVTQVSYRIGDSITNRCRRCSRTARLFGFCTQVRAGDGSWFRYRQHGAVFCYFYGYLDYPASGMDFPRYSSWPGRRHFPQLII